MLDLPVLVVLSYIICFLLSSIHFHLLFHHFPPLSSIFAPQYFFSYIPNSVDFNFPAISIFPYISLFLLSLPLIFFHFFQCFPLFLFKIFVLVLSTLPILFPFYIVDYIISCFLMIYFMNSELKKNHVTVVRDFELSGKQFCDLFS